MAIAYDSKGAGFNGSTTASSAITFSHTAASGADILLVIENTASTLTWSSVSAGGNAMTLVPSASVNHANSTYGSTRVYRLASGGTGSAITISLTPSASGQYVQAQTFAYTGVGSVGTVATRTGQSTSPSALAVTLGAGEVSFGVVAYGYSASAFGPISSPQPSGTNRHLVNGSLNASGMAVSDSTTSGQVFSATLGSASAPWSTITMILSPPSSGTTVQPGSASVSITAGSPTVTAPMVAQPGGATTSITVGTPTIGISSDTTVQPGGASIGIVGGTPAVAAPKVVAPSWAIVSFAGGTPTVAVADVLFAPILAKLTAGQSVTIQATGDSTVYGANDTANSGWVGRLGILLGQAFNVTVVRQQYNSVSTTYGSATTLYTGAGANQILIRDGGVSGWTTANVNLALSTILSVSAVDVVIHGTGFNDINASQTPTQFVTAIHSYITSAKSRCPGVPIVVTTENVANSSSYDAAFGALSTDLVGQSLPMTPALQLSNQSDTYLMDTRQAYGNAWASQWMTDTLHPNSSGYHLQAAWMLAQFAPSVPVAIPPGVATVSATGGTPTVTAPNVLSPGGASASATGGTPGVSVTDSGTRQPGQVTIVVTGGTPTVTAPYVVQPASTSVAIASGTPTVTAPKVVTPGGAMITAQGAAPDATEPTDTKQFATMTLTNTAGASMKLMNLP